MQKLLLILCPLAFLNGALAATDCEILNSGIPEISSTACCSQSSIIRCENERVVIVKIRASSGHIPQDIGEMDKLLSFQAYFGTLQGPLPISLSNLTNLQQFNVDHNNLDGTVPVWVCSMTGLEYLWLGANMFEGIFTYSFFNISYKEAFPLALISS
jgi:hypothetical protein